MKTSLWVLNTPQMISFLLYHQFREIPSLQHSRFCSRVNALYDWCSGNTKRIQTLPTFSSKKLNFDTSLKNISVIMMVAWHIWKEGEKNTSRFSCFESSSQDLHKTYNLLTCCQKATQGTGLHSPTDTHLALSSLPIREHRVGKKKSKIIPLCCAVQAAQFWKPWGPLCPRFVFEVSEQRGNKFKRRMEEQRNTLPNSLSNNK